MCVHPDFGYVKVRDPATQRVYIVAEDRLAELPGAVPKATKGKKKEAEKPLGGFEVSLALQEPNAWVLCVVSGTMIVSGTMVSIA